MKAAPAATRLPRLFGTSRARAFRACLKGKKTGTAKTLHNDAGFLDVYGQTTSVWTYRRTNAHDESRLRPRQGRARVAGLPNKLPTCPPCVQPSSRDTRTSRKAAPVRRRAVMWSRLLPLLVTSTAQQLVYKYNVSCDNATNTLVKDERRDPATGEWVGECVLLRPAWPS